MADEKEGLFRKKSMDRINSPEQMDDYLKVTSPRVWVILGAIIVLLLGFIIWSAIGTIDTGTEVIHPIKFLLQ